MIFDNWADYVVLTLYSLAILLNFILFTLEPMDKKGKPLLQMLGTVAMGLLVWSGGLWS
jgi:hypothetical protein